MPTLEPVAFRQSIVPEPEPTPRELPIQHFYYPDGISGRQWQLQSSTNLRDWADDTNYTYDESSGTVTVNTRLPVEFYRIRLFP